MSNGFPSPVAMRPPIALVGRRETAISGRIAGLGALGGGR